MAHASNLHLFFLAFAIIVVAFVAPLFAIYVTAKRLPNRKLKLWFVATLMLWICLAPVVGQLVDGYYYNNLHPLQKLQYFPMSHSPLALLYAVNGAIVATVVFITYLFMRISGRSSA